MAWARAWSCFALLVAAVAACGARTPLDLPLGAGGVVSPDGGGVVAKTCTSWTATHGAVQVSSTPSIMELQAALATPSGVLVGFADIQFPPVDPNWQLRRVGFDGSLGATNEPFTRDTSQLGWTAISIAERGGRMAAATSDETDGMFFATIDETGIPLGTITFSPGETARDLLATPSGFSVLRNPFDSSGLVPPPVSLAVVDGAGGISAGPLLLPASTPLGRFTRIAFEDGTFLLVWSTNDHCGGCRSIQTQHLSAAGESIAPPTVLRLDAMNVDLFAVAASSSGFLVAWAEPRNAGQFAILGAPFDVDGNAIGDATSFAEVTAENAPSISLATAPGGDLLAAWATGQDATQGELFVEAVSAAGAPEGAPTSLTSLVADLDEDVVVVASAGGGMALYENDPDGNGTQVYAIPLQCVF